MPNTTDYLPPPPRSLPVLEQLALLCSGVTAFIGWMFLGMGLLSSFLFVGQSEASLFFSFDGDWLWGKGVVSDIRTTNMTENDRIVYAIDFQYQVGEQSYRATSYSSYIDLELGDSVAVEYKALKPQRARV